MVTVRKAVIPAAGMGTRFLPATKDNPKEMLPLVDKPAIQYIVEEAVSSGIDDIIIITGRGKYAIENHFDVSYELEQKLRNAGKTDALQDIHNISELADIFYIRQKEPQGLGHAILQAEKHINGEPFAVLLGDDVVFSDMPCTKQMMDIYEKHKRSIIAVEKITPEQTEAYGVIKKGKKINNHMHLVDGMVEKPKKEKAPSNLGILGRYILEPEIFSHIRTTKKGHNNEIQITDALRKMNRQKAMIGYEFSGKRYDLGNKMDWLKTTIEVAVMRGEFKKELLPFLQQIIKNEERKK